MTSFRNDHYTDNGYSKEDGFVVDNGVVSIESSESSIRPVKKRKRLVKHRSARNSTRLRKRRAFSGTSSTQSGTDSKEEEEEEEEKEEEEESYGSGEEDSREEERRLDEVALNDDSRTTELVKSFVWDQSVVRLHAEIRAKIYDQMTFGNVSQANLQATELVRSGATLRMRLDERLLGGPCFLCHVQTNDLYTLMLDDKREAGFLSPSCAERFELMLDAARLEARLARLQVDAFYVSRRIVLQCEKTALRIKESPDPVVETETILEERRNLIEESIKGIVSSLDELMKLAVRVQQHNYAY